MRLQVEYFSSEELFRDTLQQFAKGGILVRVPMVNGPELYSRALLELKTPAGYIEIDTEVVQVIGGLGIALAFDAEDSRLLGLLRESERNPFTSDKAASHRLLPSFGEGTSPDADAPQDQDGSQAEPASKAAGMPKTDFPDDWPTLRFRDKAPT